MAKVIYGLRLVGAEQVRYVGYTIHGAKNRLARHIYAAFTRGCKQPVYDWLRHHGSDNVESVILEHLPDDSEMSVLHEREKFWIAELGTHLSHGGLNVTTGGDGVVGHTLSDARKQQISERHRNKVVSDETRAKLSAAHTGIKYTPRTPDSFSNRSKSAMHSRWHLKRGIVSPSCQLCINTTEEVC